MRVRTKLRVCLWSLSLTGIAVSLVGFGGIARVSEANTALSENMTILLGQLLIITEDHCCPVNLRA